MKIIVIGDTHFDSGSTVVDNQIQYNNQIKLFKEQIFPYMKENDINTILQLGDFTDNRTKISQFVQHNLKLDIFEELKKNDFTLHHLLGNHDIFYSENRSIYSTEVFEIAYKDNYKIYKDIRIENFNSNNSFLIVPWLCNEDEKIKMQEIIKNENPNMIFGHFEISNFYMSKTMKDVSGLDANYFKGIKCWSGHYHLKQEQDNVMYAGVPYQLTWENHNDEHGFYVLDTETLKYEFIENTVSLKHLKVFINSEEKIIEVQGFNKSYTSKITSKTDYTFLKGHKLKIYIDKDNAYNKKIIETIQELAFKVRVHVQEQESEIVESKDDFSEFNLKSNIIEYIDTDFKKEIFEDIYAKAEREINS